MDIIHIRADGQHIHLRDLFAEQSALQAGMDADDLPVLAEAGFAGFLIDGLDGRIRTELPAGITALVCNGKSTNSTAMSDTWSFPTTMAGSTRLSLNITSTDFAPSTTW